MSVGVFFKKFGQISNFGGVGLVRRWYWVTVSARAGTYFDSWIFNSRARAFCACSRCGWGCLDIFFPVYYLSFLSLSLSLSERLPSID